MDFTKDDARSLASKLDAMDLTGAERSALDAVFEAADDDTEVSGYSTLGDVVCVKEYLPTIVNVMGARSLIEGGPSRVLRMEGEFTDEP